MAEFVTFKPLARGRFRCNNCGKTVKQKQLDTHRSSHKNRPIPTELSAPTLKTAELWHGLIRCPHCGWRNYADKIGIVVCISCREKFTAV